MTYWVRRTSYNSRIQRLQSNHRHTKCKALRLTRSLLIGILVTISYQSLRRTFSVSCLLFCLWLSAILFLSRVEKMWGDFGNIEKYVGEKGNVHCPGSSRKDLEWFYSDEEDFDSDENYDESYELASEDQSGNSEDASSSNAKTILVRILQNAVTIKLPMTEVVGIVWTV